MTKDVLIIGGGLAGLSLADTLMTSGAEVLVLEARPRLGGRIMSYEANGAAYDLGPAWFWPGQPRIEALTQRLGLDRFEQHWTGHLSYEDERGHVSRDRGFASMQGSWRLDGGLMQLCDGLAAHIGKDRVRTDAPVVGLSQRSDHIVATLKDGTTVAARHVALAIPPRLIAKHIAFSPALPAVALETMAATPTWMAGQAKALAIYQTPFWRDAGLSGDAMSRFGPMVEIHDASPLHGQTGALFGFIGLPPSARAGHAELRKAVISQLTRLFGPKAKTPLDVIIQDWARDPYTATAADHAPLRTHPTYGLAKAWSDLWGGHLHLAGTETAPQFGGYLEGALEAADAAAARLLPVLNATEAAKTAPGATSTLP